MRVESVNHQLRWKGSCLGKPSIVVTISQDGENFSSDDVIKQIRQIKACSRIVFAGLDPMVEQFEIMDIIAKLQEGCEIVISTTGGVMPDVNIRSKVNAWEINIPTEEQVMPFKYNDEALRFYSIQKNATYEWDVNYETDMLEVKKAVHFHHIPWKRVILNPVSEEEEFDDKFKWLEDYCLEKGCSMGNPIIHYKTQPGEEDGNNRFNKRDSELSDKTPED